MHRAGSRLDADYPQPDTTSPQLTLRAIVTGMVLGGALSLCNIYSGLKVGWAFNVSIAAALLSYAFWQSLARIAGTRSWGLLENNTNQTAASSAASIIGAGLVAPIPALTIMTGRRLDWPSMVLWTFSVSLLGVVVAIALRRQMLIVDRLSFPVGVATAETIREVYSRGKEAVARVSMLVFAGVISAAVKGLGVAFGWHPVGLPLRVELDVVGSAHRAPLVASATNLSLALDPSLLMVGFGAIVGLRTGLSALLGSVIAWGAIAPELVSRGWVETSALPPDKAWFKPLVEWLLWPGVALMVSASFVSLAFSWRSFVEPFRRRRPANARSLGTAAPLAATDVPRAWLGGGIVVAMLFAIALQSRLFDIPLGLASFAVVLTFLLAVVAARVSGETGITPIGSMGKVTQLSLGFLSGGQPNINLMSANVTGGAASQCADMLHDLKTGLLVGAAPRAQAVAQVFGVLAGSLAGSAAYLLLVPDPEAMLLTDQWPAPAVATWKAVAELLSRGWEAVPPGAIASVLIAATVGAVLALCERIVPQRVARYLPSPTSVGLAFVMPAWYAISIAFGAIVAASARRIWPHWSTRFIIVIAGGLVAGESLAGIGSTIWTLVAGR
jgi:putative OPT family oligopeptide transporter